MKKTPTLRILFFEPGEPPRVREIANSLEAIKAVVGGCFDACYPDRDVACVCNDTAIVDGLAPNFWIEGPTYLGNPIHGPAFLCGLAFVDEDGEEDRDFVSITDEQIARFARLRRLAWEN